MEKSRIESQEELWEFIDGCTLLGVGGGGNPEEGFKALSDALNEKGPIEWIDVDQVDDDAIALCIFLMGSTAPLTEEKIKKKNQLGLTTWKYPLNLANAVQEWENYTGKKADIIIPLEVGGSNMPVPMAVAKKLGKTIVDGDYAGRAIPEIFQISLMLEEVPFWPAASVDKYGNICIIKEAISLSVAERIGKYLSEVAFGSTGLAGFPITGKQLKRLLVRGSVSQAYKLGKVLKRVREGKENLRQALEKERAKLLFKGKVTKKEWKDEEGYYIGFHTLDGDDEFKGEKARIFFKNENHIVWKDGNYLASSPDLICCIRPDTVKPVRNEEIEIGSYLEVYGFSCNPIMQRKEVMDRLCPRYFGFELDYEPLKP